jgi:RNase adapter protein RapZ
MSLSLGNLRLFIVVAGVSGAGRSTALYKMADLGLTIVDNLPIALLPSYFEYAGTLESPLNRAAVTVATHSHEDVNDLITTLAAVDERDGRVQVIFLDSDTDVILKRYSETRRPHPRFDPSTDSSLEETIARERERLSPLKFRSTLILDTSPFSLHDLRREIALHFERMSDGIVQPLRVNLISFGFKHGPLRECDLLADVRFLPNPYFVEGLRTMTGVDNEVSSFVLATADASEFLEKYASLLNFLLPRFRREGKAYLNIGIGCTGGKHRSVAIAEELRKGISGEGLSFTVRHRDLLKE